MSSHDPQRPSREDIIKGVYFPVRYVGSIAIEAAMKSLKFDVRTAVAKECIGRVCEAGNYIPARSSDLGPEISALVGGAVPHLARSGTDVTLVVSGESLDVAAGQERLFSHPMPNISFASGGDEDSADFVCYVGKSEEEGRQCLVFECGVANATRLLEAIGEAFKFRFDVVQQQAAAASAAKQAAEAAKTAEESLISFAHPPLPPSIPPLGGGGGGGWSEAEVLSAQPWYHGPTSRQDAEALLKRDGDFLVRQSGQSANQFVLTGLQNGTPKHLLLIDTDGTVRTKDRDFASVSHLISYHRENNLPITSAESALILKAPILHNSPA